MKNKIYYTLEYFEFKSQFVYLDICMEMSKQRKGMQLMKKLFWSSTIF